MFFAKYLRFHAILFILVTLFIFFMKIREAKQIEKFLPIMGIAYGFFLMGMLFLLVGNLVADSARKKMFESWVTPREQAIRDILMWDELGETGQVRRRLEELEELLPGFDEEIQETEKRLLNKIEDLIAKVSHKVREQRIQDLRLLLSKGKGVLKKYGQAPKNPTA